MIENAHITVFLRLIFILICSVDFKIASLFKSFFYNQTDWQTVIVLFLRNLFSEN